MKNKAQIKPLESLSFSLDKNVPVKPKNGLKRIFGQNNRKIKNAPKTEVDGIKFDSKLESFMYTLLRDAGIAFEMQKTYCLQDKFRYRGEAVRAITLTIDYFLPTYNMIIDTKGMQTQQGAMRYKMLKKVLYEEAIFIHEPPQIELPHNQKECRELLAKLLNS